MKRSNSDRNEDGEFIAITPEIMAMAREIRATFLEMRSRYAPHARGGVRDMDPYIKAARLCLELGEEPRVFTAHQIAEMAAINMWYPTGLASRKLSATAEEKKDAQTSMSIESYTGQLYTFERRLAFFTPQQTLADPVATFSPLFICMMALRFDLKDLFGHYRRSARLELDANPIARDIFGKEVDTL